MDALSVHTEHVLVCRVKHETRYKKATRPSFSSPYKPAHMYLETCFTLMQNKFNAPIKDLLGFVLRNIDRYHWGFLMTSLPLENAAIDDRVESPKLHWWISIVGGLTLLGFQGLHPEFYNWWIATVHPLPAQNVMAWIFIACLPIHIYEAVYVYRLANLLGMPESAMGWSIQTFILGFPSTSLLRKRAKAMGVAK